jgi:hypothetical protein
MALIQPGPLISDIAGSVGGVTFHLSRHGLSASRKSLPVDSHSYYQNSVRVLFRRAAADWSRLTYAVKLQWTAAANRVSRQGPFHARHTLDGRQLFFNLYLAQLGAASFVTPSPPTYSGSPSPTTPGATVWAVALYLDRLSRPLVPTEHVLTRVYQAEPSGTAQRRAALLRTIETVYPSPLYALPDYGLGIGSIAARAWHNGGILTSSSKTLEFYIKDQGGVGVPYQMLFSWANNTGYIFLNTIFNLYLHDSGSNRLIAAFNPSTSWRYVALVWVDATKKIRLYINGAYVAQATYDDVMGFTDNFSIGYAGIQTVYVAAYDEVRISYCERSAAEIAAVWNSGNLLRQTVDAYTVALWRFDACSATLAPDLGPFNFPLALVGDPRGPGFSAVPLAYAADSPGWTSRRTWFRTIPSLGPNAGAPSNLACLDW